MALMFDITRSIILLFGTIGFFVIWYFSRQVIKQEFDISIAYMMLNITIALFYFVFFYGLMIKFSPRNIIVGSFCIGVLIMFYIFIVFETEITNC